MDLLRFHRSQLRGVGVLAESNLTPISVGQ
jgi:hypothetical protein